MRGYQEFKDIQRSMMERTVAEMVREFEKEPSRIPDFLAFGSRFYRHSLKNNMLIYKENPQAVYCQSYEAWNRSIQGERNYRIKKGEKAVKVYVPYQAVILKIEGRMVPLEQASKEEKVRYQAGEIESITETRHDGVKGIFDIAQTNCPASELKKFFQTGYPKEAYPKVIKGLEAYAEEQLEEKIETRGDLPDAERISALIDGISRELLSQDMQKTDSEKAFEAAAFAVMTENHLGLTVNEERKNELADAWERLRGEHPEQSVFVNLNHTYKMARKSYPMIQEKIELYLEPAGNQMPVPKAGQEEPLKKREQDRLSNQELMEEIKRQVRITDYAQEHGYRLVRVGRYYTLAGHDSVRIDTDKNCYWRNSVPGTSGIGRGDSVIGFAAEFVHDGNMHETLKELSGRVYVPEHYIPAKTQKSPEKREHRELVLPEKADNMRRVFAYLTKSRYIDQEVVQDFVDRKMLYQDKRGNCVFVSYDKSNEPVFASFRGTNTDIRYMGDVAGCDYSKGFYVDNGSNKVIVTESVIDAMSVMSVLNNRGVDYKAYDYMPPGGVGKYEPLIRHLEENPKEQVLLAEDHDLGGVESMQIVKDRMISELHMKEEQITFHVPAGNDWNQELSNAVKKMQPVSEIDFFKDTGLPEIHYCAVQSTEQAEEKGFRIRDGKHQYRLLELNQEGNLVPVALRKQNTMFFSKEAVEENIPAMYKKVSYQELLGMQKGMEKSRKTEEALKTGQEAEIPDREKLLVKEYFAEEGICMARGEYQGEEILEAVCRENGELFVSTGMTYDDTYEKHPLTEEQTEELDRFLKENNYELDETYPILQLTEKTEGIPESREKQNAGFLDRLQKQEMDRPQNQGIDPAPVMEMQI